MKLQYLIEDIHDDFLNLSHDPNPIFQDFDIEIIDDYILIVNKHHYDDRDISIKITNNHIIIDIYGIIETERKTNYLVSVLCDILINFITMNKQDITHFYIAKIRGNRNAVPPKIAKFLLKTDDPNIAWIYVNEFLKRACPELEAILATDKFTACNYATRILQGPFPAGEAVIAQSGYFSYEYAVHALGHRFIAGEAVIAKSKHYALKYAKQILLLKNYSNELKGHN